MITLDSVTRELPIMFESRTPAECPRCADGRALLSDVEAELVVELAGGRSGDWRAARCPVKNGWHMVRRTHHERRDATIGLKRGAAVLAALFAIAALALPWLGRF